MVQTGLGRFVHPGSPWLLLPGCLGRSLLPQRLATTYQPPTMAQGGEEEQAIRTPKRLSETGSQHTSRPRAEPRGRQQVWEPEVTELKSALQTPLRDLAQQGSGLEGAEAWRTGQWEEGKVPRGPEIWDPEQEGVGNSSTKPNRSISLASMLEKFWFHMAPREGGREGDGGCRLPPRVSLEKGDEPPQEPHLAKHTPGTARRLTIAGEAPREGIGHLPGLKKINGRKKNKITRKEERERLRLS